MNAPKRDPYGRLNCRTGGRGAVARVHVSDPHASVPVRLMEAESGLTPAARLALIYLLDLGRRPNWTIYISYVVRKLGYGNRRWPRVRKELQDAGFLTVRRGHDEAGDWSWSIDVYDRPLARPCIPTVCGDAECGGANRGDRRRSTSRRCTTRRSSSSTRACARVEPPCTPNGPAGAASLEAKSGERKRKRTHRETGCVYWYSDEVDEIGRLVAEHGLPAVRNQVKRARAVGAEPLPNVVETALVEAKRQAAEREGELAKAEAKAKARAEQEAAWNDPARRAAAEQALAAIRETLK